MLTPSIGICVCHWWEYLVTAIPLHWQLANVGWAFMVLAPVTAVRSGFLE